MGLGLPVLTSRCAGDFGRPRRRILTALTSLSRVESGATADSHNALTSLSNGDETAIADNQKALTSLADDVTATANGQKALTPLANDVTATANGQKALTSLAVAEQDILGRSASSARSPARFARRGTHYVRPSSHRQSKL